MANLARVRVAWSGAAVTGPGVSTLYMDEADSGWVSALSAFFTSVANRFPAGITWTIPGTGDLIDVATGELSGSWTDTATTSVNSSGGNGYVKGAGGRIEWPTAGVRNGRRVRGSTFLCPLDNGAWSTSGVMNPTVQSALQAAAGTLYTALQPGFRIYSRPSPAGAGQASAVTDVVVPADVSWLRSRRT